MSSVAWATIDLISSARPGSAFISWFFHAAGGIGFHQLVLDRLGGIDEQLDQVLPRDVRAGPDAQSKVAVVARPADQGRYAEFGEFRAGIMRGRRDHGAIAAVHQHV